MEKIIFILPVLPHYRLDFLEDLNQKYKENNIDLIVLTGTNQSKKNIKHISRSTIKLIKNKTFGMSLFGFQIQWQWKLIRSVLKENPDRIIMLWHAGKLNYNILLLILKIKKIPYILWGSGYGDSRIGLNKFQLQIKKIFKNLFIKNSFAYICYGTDFAKKLKNNGYPENKIHVVQNTIKVENIYNSLSLNISNRKYDIIKFLFVGALISEKRIDIALNSCKILMNLGYRFRFDIVGEGLEYNNLIKLVNTYKLNKHVRFYGSKFGEELAEFFKESNVFILPGTGGLAINEAMAYSLPIISTPGDGTILDLVEDNKNGFLLDFNCKDDVLVEKMKFFLEVSEDKLKNMEEQSLKRIKQFATMGNMVNKFYKISTNNMK